VWRQDLIEIFDSQPSNAGIRRADTVDRRVEKLARENRREKGKDVLEMTGALGLGWWGLGRLGGVRKIQQTIAPPDLRCHRERLVHDCEDAVAIDRQLVILRQNPIDRATAVVAHFESCIVEPAHQAVEAPSRSDGAKNARQASANGEIGRRLDQRVNQQTEMGRGDRLEHVADRRQDVIPRQKIDDLSDVHPREVRRVGERGGDPGRVR